MAQLSVKSRVLTGIWSSVRRRYDKRARQVFGRECGDVTDEVEPAEPSAQLDKAHGTT